MHLTSQSRYFLVAMKGLPKKGFMNVVHCEENEAMNDCLLNLVDHFLLVLVAYLPDMLKFILSD